jgi:hypothetical protein
MTRVQVSHHLSVLCNGEFDSVFECARRAHKGNVINIDTMSNPLVRCSQAGRYEDRQQVELQLRGGMSRPGRNASGGLHRPAGQVGLA